MINYALPTSVEIDGHNYSIRSDYRAILDVIGAITDPELDDQDKAIVVLSIFYVDSIPLKHIREALQKAMEFINMGAPDKDKKMPKLMDWEQDFQYIIAPINRVMGTEIRSIPYLHWWTFISAYYEIGDCTFAQIVRIRDAKAKGKKLDDFDKEWYRNNRDIVDLKATYTEAENTLLKEWGL